MSALKFSVIKHLVELLPEKQKIDLMCVCLPVDIKDKDRVLSNFLGGEYKLSPKCDYCEYVDGYNDENEDFCGVYTCDTCNKHVCAYREFSCSTIVGDKVFCHHCNPCGVCGCKKLYDPEVCSKCHSLVCEYYSCFDKDKNICRDCCE